MTRKKVNLAYITNDSMRKSTFNKRKKGFFKKIHELSVLCGIEACAVIYSPFSSSPEVWPSNSEVKNLVEKFEKVPEMDQEKKMVNHEGFIKQSIIKATENNNKKMKDNKDKALKEAMFQILAGKGDIFKLTDKNRDDLCKYIDQYLKELYHQRNQTPNLSHLEYGESSSAANAMEPVAMGSSSSFPNLDVFNPLPLVNELWASRPIISGSQKSEAPDTFGINFLPAASGQQGHYQMMNQVGVYDQHPNLNLNLNQYQQKFEDNPIVAQNGTYSQRQNLNHQQEEWLLNQMMNHPHQMRFPMIDGNNRYYHHQS